MFRFYFKSFYFGLKKARPWLVVVVVLLVPFSTFAENTVQPLTDLFERDMIPVPEDADFGGFVSGIYDLIIYVAGVLAVLLITYGGVLYLTSGPNASQVEEGKKYITNALLGLLLALSAWLILNTINPAMLDFDMEFIDPEFRERITEEQMAERDGDIQYNNIRNPNRYDNDFRHLDRSMMRDDEIRRIYKEACRNTEGCDSIDVNLDHTYATGSYGSSQSTDLKLDWEGEPPDQFEIDSSRTRQRYGTDGVARIDSHDEYVETVQELEAAGYNIQGSERVVDERWYWWDDEYEVINYELNE